DLGSAATRLPFPSARASKRTERCSSFAKVISTFQMPITLGDFASLMAMLWVIKPKINMKVTLMLFGNPHCPFRQGIKTLCANEEVYLATCRMPRVQCLCSPDHYDCQGYGRRPGVGRGLGAGGALRNVAGGGGVVLAFHRTCRRIADRRARSGY